MLVRDIEVMSVCEHHLLPFKGVAHIGYIPGPNGRITGLSKLARLVEVFARRPQVQERLTSQIADLLMDKLEPRGVIAVLECEHICMAMRGIQKDGAKTVTSAVRGIFQSDAKTRVRGDGAHHRLTKADQDKILRSRVRRWRDRCSRRGPGEGHNPALTLPAPRDAPSTQTPALS